MSPVNAVSEIRDWLNASLRGAAHPHADGSLSLAKRDFIGGFSAPETDGIPSGWSMPLPSDISGHAIMVGQVDEGQDSVTRQNTTPHPLSASHWTGSRPIVRGQRPVNKLYQASLPRPPKPIVESVPTTDAGFPAGTPKVAYTEIAGGGLETQLSGYSQVTVSEGQGINLTLPSELSADRVGIGIYVSYAGTGAFRKVRNLSAGYLDSGARSYTLTEYRQGAKPPSENRTMLGQGKKPGKMRFQRGKFALAPRVYRHTYTRVTRFGESLAAPFSDRLNILERHTNRALWIPPVSRSKGSVGLQLYVEMDDEVFKVVDRGSNVPYLSYDVLINRGVDIYGVSSDDSRGGEQGTRPRAGGNPRFILVQQDLPEEDTSGLEGPGADAELELEARGQTIPEPGRRFYQTAYLSDEGQGPPSVFTRHDTPAGSMPRLSLPHPVNVLKNAEFTELKPNGTPVAWNYRQQPLGTTDFDVTGGTLELYTIAPAEDTPYFESDPFTINSLSDLTVRGVLEAQIVEGYANVVLFTYDGAGNQLNATNAVQIGYSGRAPFSKVFGPSGTAIPESAVSGTLVFRMTNAAGARNMRMSMSHMVVHPFEGTPRKVSNLYVDGEEADYNPPPGTPYPVNGHTGFGLPPAIYEPPEAESGLIQRLGFEGGFGGWTQHYSGSATNAITSSAAISGANGLRLGSAAGAPTRISYIQRTVDPATEIGFRQKVRVAGAVTGTSNSVTLMRLQQGTGGNSGDVIMATLTLDSNGTLQARRRDRLGNLKAQDIGRVPEGSYVDVEMVIGGANSASAVLTVLMGLNGRTRNVVFTDTGIDWRGVRVDRLRSGVDGVTSVMAGWIFDIDSIALTERGDSLSDASAPPEGMNPELPDRPRNADGTYRDTDAYGEAIRQFYAFVLEGEDRYAPTSERYAVLPEETYYPAIFARSDSEECEPWRVVCYTTSGDSVDVGSLWQAGPSQPWADRQLGIVIPADCVELQFVGQRLAPGEYVAQEPALSWRTASREAGYVEDTGGFTVTLPYNPEDTYYNPSEGDGWRELALAHEGSVTARYRSGSNLLTWSEYESDPALVQENSYAQIDGELSLDEDNEAPLIPSGGAYLAYDLTRPTLLMPDGSPLPGGAVVGGLREAYERADYEVESVGGRTIATPTTPRVLRLAGVEISVFTPEARRLVEDYCMDWEWLMELPLQGGTPSGARGYLFTVRFPDVIEMEDLEPPFTRSDHTFLHSTAEVEGPIDCLEVAEL